MAEREKSPEISRENTTKSISFKRYILIYIHCAIYFIRESVDSLCRDDADTPMPPYIRKAYNRPNAAFVSLFR